MSLYFCLVDGNPTREFVRSKTTKRLLNTLLESRSFFWGLGFRGDSSRVDYFNVRVPIGQSTSDAGCATVPLA